MQVRERILAENARGSMVARRLIWLLGKADLNNVSQILDIGSWHLGQTIEFANIFQDAIIDAFEPVPESYNLCVKRLDSLSAKHKERINIHNVALSNAVGEIPFYPVNTNVSKGIDAGFSSMFRFEKDINKTFINQKWVQNEIRVNADTLDNWAAKNKVTNVDIIWMDAQGAELLVLQGGVTLLKNTKVILTEVGLKPYYEGHTMKANIDDLLTSLGFKELKSASEMNIRDYEANVIYINSTK